MMIKRIEEGGKEEKDEYVASRACSQKQCIYNQYGGCRACAECGEGSNSIKCSCSVCLACENIPDMLRWDDGSLGVNPAIKEKNEKEQEKELKPIEVVR